MTILSEIVSGLGGVIFGAGATFIVAQRKLHADNVTAERTKWREKIRLMAQKVISGESLAVWSDLALNTNPEDCQDVALVKLVRAMEGQIPSNEKANEITTRFALLLKHDWERAKRDTSWWPFGNKPDRKSFNKSVY